MPDTDFDRAAHGFAFRNTFDNHRFAFGGIHLNFGGRCAGMVYTALDYRNSNPALGRPADAELPPEGSALGTYISIRQDAATWGTVDRWMELILGQPARSAEFYAWGMQEGRGQAGQLKTSINANIPAPIGLVAANDLVAHHHQALAIGYDGSGDDLRIRVYDPNHLAVKVLRPFPALQRWGYDGTGAGEGPDNAVWRSYFVDPNYRRRQPFSHDPGHLPDMSGRSFRGQNLHRQVFAGALAVGADFTGATATYTDFGVANLTFAKFEGANVSHSNFKAASLRRANFTGADLKTSTLDEARASEANFQGADLKLVNDSVRENHIGVIELDGANFHGADLHKAKLPRAFAPRANFYGANLSHANLREADLSNANLEGADLRHADVRGATFTGARLRGTDLRSADMTGAIGLPPRL